MGTGTGLGGILSPLHQSLYHKVGAKYLEGKGHILSLFPQGLIQHLPTMGAQMLFCEGQGQHETKVQSLASRQGLCAQHSIHLGLFLPESKGLITPSGPVGD